jgi:trehalose 6-phosphate phosphatase
MTAEADATERERAVDRIAAAPRLLIALDFDGTLAPLVDEPMTARALPAAKSATERLSLLPDTVVAFVSGRSLADLRTIAEHGDDSRIWLTGSHGAERWRPAGVPAAETAEDDGQGADAAALVAAADEAVEGLAGAWIEPKAFGFGVHTRLASAEDAVEAASRVDALMAERAQGWRRRAGRDVVEFAWRHEGKDTAVAELREETGATAVLFAGDDVTDEDALRSLLPGDLGVRVGEGETAADIRVPDAEAFASLLGELAARRAAAR